jgi:predicted TIM-barrel fold metal-dependent hydrolase
MRHWAGCACGGTLSLGRRALFCGAAAGLLGAAAPSEAPWRIDVHHHISPPAWLTAVKQAKLDTPPMNNWSPQASLDAMDEAGVMISVVSPTTPQAVFLPAAQAASVCRDSNEYAAKLRADHPGRFGMFAMLPLPHLDESLKAIEYGMDTLKADGVGILTSYGDKWLGDPYFAPVFDELNRRRATVYTHPTSANCCVNVLHGIPDYAIEWGTDTVRAIATLILWGTSRNYPDINFIFSHGGGSLTSFAERFQIQLLGVPPYKGTLTREMVDGELRRFYYDTAQVANAVTIEALVKLVPVSQVVFGTDFNYRTPIEHVRGLAARFSEADQRAIERDNPLRILPGLRTG